MSDVPAIQKPQYNIQAEIMKTDKEDCWTVLIRDTGGYPLPKAIVLDSIAKFHAVLLNQYKEEKQQEEIIRKAQRSPFVGKA